MVFGDQDVTKKIIIDEQELENVEKFIYLGSTFTYDLDCNK